MHIYVVRTASLSHQLSDRPKLVFFAVLLLLEFWVYRQGGIWRSVALGAFVGMIPSVWFGVAAVIDVQGDADWIRAQQWLERTGHRKAGAAWVPPMPRWAYFNTQIVRYADGRIYGPRLLLKRLRDVLSAESGG